MLSVRVIEFGEERKLLNSRDVTAEERLDTMRRDFVANVSHELKTPVTVLSGFVETLARRVASTSTAAQRQRFLGLMAEQAKRMQRLVEDLLTLSALESDAAPADEQPIDMRSFVERLAEEARALSAGRHRDRGGDRTTTAACSAAPKELHSAFSNLVSNAVRYTPEGGTVRLALARWTTAAACSASPTPASASRRATSRASPSASTASTAAARAKPAAPGLGLAIVKHALTRHQAVLDVDERARARLDLQRACSRPSGSCRRRARSRPPPRPSRRSTRSKSEPRSTTSSSRTLCSVSA